MKRFLLTLLMVLLLPLSLEAATYTLTWQDTSSGNNQETSFRLERRTGASGTFSEIGFVGADIQTYVDSTAQNNTLYCYRVKARNAVGDSGYSNVACAPVPAAITNLAVTSAFVLTWTDTSNIEEQTKIERKSGSGNYTQIVVVGSNVVTYTDASAVVGTQYCYRVRASNSVGDGAYSNEACLTPAGPNVPSNLTIQ